METVQSWITDHPSLFSLSALGVLLLLCTLLNAAMRHLVIPLVERLVSHSRTAWDDALQDVFALRPLVE